MQRLGAAPFLVGAALVVYPLIVPPFFAFQIGGQILILGMIGLSLMVLAGHGGLRHPIGPFLGAGLCAAQDLCHRSHRGGAFQHAHRPGVSHYRFRFPGWDCGTLAEAEASPRSKIPALAVSL